MDEKPTLEDILAVYNSIHPSRRRWYGNTNKLRNDWKELYQILEKASGRSGAKPVVFDPNWHTVASKGGTRGAVNRVFGDDTLDTVGPDAAVIITEAGTPEQPAEDNLAVVNNEVVEVTPVDHSDDPLFQVEVKDESEPTPVVVKKKPAKKKKK